MFSRLLCLLVLLVASKVSADEWSQKHLGFSGIPIEGNDQLMKAIGIGRLPTKRGLLVATVNPNTATAKGGLLPMAIVTTINRKPVGSDEDVQSILSDLEVGSEILIGGHALRNNVWKSGNVKTRVMTKRAVLEATMARGVDKIENITVWKHRFTAEEQVNRVELFVTQQGNSKPAIHLETIYIAKDWLFVNGLTAARQGQKSSVALKPFSGQDKVKGGYILERNAAAVPDDFAQMMCEIDCTIRFEGKDAVYDHSQSLSECWINRDVFDFYRMISSSP